MIAESLLVSSILTLLMLGLATTIAVMLHASIGAARERHLIQPLSEARHVLAVALSSNTALLPQDLELLRSLPRERVITLVSEAARSFQGEGDTLLRELAEELRIGDRGLNLIESRLWWRRLEGVRLLGLFDESRHLRPRLLEDRHPLVRAQAAEWTAQHATGAEIGVLVALLQDQDGLARYSAKDSLIRLGTDAAAAVAVELDSASGQEAVPLLEVAAAINDPRLVPAGVRLASDRDNRVRALVAQLLGGVGGAEALVHLTELLEDPDPAVRAAAADGLGRLGCWSMGSRLADRLEDPSWDVRRAAGLALRSIGAPGQLLLRRATGSTDGFAADMARQVQNLRELDEVVP